MVRWLDSWMVERVEIRPIQKVILNTLLTRSSFPKLHEVPAPAVMPPGFVTKRDSGKVLLIKLHDAIIHQDVGGFEKLFQNNALQGSAAAEGHVGLAKFKSATAHVNDHPVECFPLRFVDGDGPGQFQRVLFEAPDDFCFYLLRVLTGGFVAQDFPFHGPHLDLAGAARFVGEDFYRFPVQVRYLPDGSIDEVALRVVFDEHDLSALFELQQGIGRVEARVELALDGCREVVCRAGQVGQFPLVDAVGNGVERGERDVAGAGLEVGLVAGVEVFEVFPVGLVEAHGIEQAQEAPVFLPIDLAEFQHVHFKITQGIGRKKVRGFIGRPEELPLRFGGDDRRQLEQVADEHHLQAAKRQRIVPVEPERAVNGIQQIGPYHADFINHHDLDFLEPFSGCAFVDVPGGDETGRKAKKRVDGLPFHVEGSDARRGQDDHLFFGRPPEELQQRGLARTGPAGNEHATVRLFQVVQRIPEIAVEFEWCFVEHTAKVGLLCDLLQQDAICNHTIFCKNIDQVHALWQCGKCDGVTVAQQYLFKYLFST